MYLDEWEVIWKMVAELIIKGIGRVVYVEKKIRNTALAMLRSEMLEKIANVWVGEEGWGKVHLNILVIKKLKQVIGNVRGINRPLLKIHEAPTEKKTEKLIIRRTWVRRSCEIQGEYRIKCVNSNCGLRM